MAKLSDYITQKSATAEIKLLDSITTSATATYALTKDGVAYTPSSARSLLVSLNGVTQAPESAYDVSGTNIVFDSALTADDVIDYILVLGDAIDIGTPANETVGVSQLSNELYSANGQFALPAGTTAQRPASPANGHIRYNTSTNRLEVYHEVTSEWSSSFFGGVNASGGTETTITENGVAYKVHAFTSSGNFIVTSAGDIEYLIVGGGGSGVSRHVGTASGGGGGSQTEGTASVSVQTYSIVVGAGGAGWTSANNGNSSSAFGGSSSGGAYGTNNTGGDGADGSLYSKFIEYGTTSANVNGGGGYFGGQGGDNGPDRGDAYAGRGGAGGGGKGHADGYGTGSGQSGYANSGGGGGAGNSGYTASGSGGSGIVIIRYPI